MISVNLLLISLIFIQLQSKLFNEYYCKFHLFIVILLFRSNEKSSLAETAHGTLVSLLRSWIGVLYFCDPSEDHSKSGLSSIVRALHVQNSNTRVSNISLLLYQTMMNYICINF